MATGGAAHWTGSGGTLPGVLRGSAAGARRALKLRFPKRGMQHANVKMNPAKDGKAGIALWCFCRSGYGGECKYSNVGHSSGPTGMLHTAYMDS